ncbi:MAG: glycosyl hydrolase family 28-related protein [Verrucomicrobiales bacterium]
MTLRLLLPLAFAAGFSQAAVPVTEFGAKGDGVADDTRAIQAALDSGKNIVVPEGVFLVTNALEPKAGQVVELVGTVRIADSNIQPLTADAAAGQSEVTVADASGYYPGQWVALGAEDLKIQGGGNIQVRRTGGDCGRIADIEGNVVSFELPLRRAYTVAANARLGTQPSAFLVTQPGVRIHGTGIIDGNKAGQFDIAPADMTAVKGRGEETRAGCGISIDSAPGPIAHLRVEGITIRDCVLHNLSLYRARHTLISGVTSIGAHDKNILLRYSEYCQLIGNQCLDSEFEDGIILYTGNHHCIVQGNVCANNARSGITVNAFQTGNLLSGNVCTDNRRNLSVRGDHGSSTGDFCSGDGSVVIQGRGNQINGLVALCPVNISATDLNYTGGIVSGTEAEPLRTAMEITRTSDDRRVALVDGVRIRGVTVKNCLTAVNARGVVRDVRLIECRIEARNETVAIAPECEEHVTMERNELHLVPAETPETE